MTPQTEKNNDNTHIARYAKMKMRLDNKILLVNGI